MLPKNVNNTAKTLHLKQDVLRASPVVHSKSRSSWLYYERTVDKPCYTPCIWCLYNVMTILLLVSYVENTKVLVIWSPNYRFTLLSSVFCCHVVTKLRFKSGGKRDFSRYRTWCKAAEFSRSDFSTLKILSMNKYINKKPYPCSFVSKYSKNPFSYIWHSFITLPIWLIMDLMVSSRI